MSRRGGQAGFTLLEILVALVVLGLLMAALAQGTAFGIHAWNGQAANVARNSDLDSADRTVRTLLTRMLPPASPDEPSLQGTASALQFVSELPQGAPIASPRMAAIRLFVDEQHRLILRWAPQPHAKRLGAMPASHDDVVLAGVAHMDVAYHARTGNWTNSWTVAGLPQLIRLHLIMTGRRTWPDILIAPMRDSISETGE